MAKTQTRKLPPTNAASKGKPAKGKPDAKQPSKAGKTAAAPAKGKAATMGKGKGAGSATGTGKPAKPQPKPLTAAEQAAAAERAAKAVLVHRVWDRFAAIAENEKATAKAGSILTLPSIGIEGREDICVVVFPSGADAEGPITAGALIVRNKGRYDARASMGLAKALSTALAGVHIEADATMMGDADPRNVWARLAITDMSKAPAAWQRARGMEPTPRIVDTAATAIRRALTPAKPSAAPAKGATMGGKKKKAA